MTGICLTYTAPYMKMAAALLNSHQSNEQQKEQRSLVHRTRLLLSVLKVTINCRKPRESSSHLFLYSWGLPFHKYACFILWTDNKSFTVLTAILTATLLCSLWIKLKGLIGEPRSGYTVFDRHFTHREYTKGRCAERGCSQVNTFLSLCGVISTRCLRRLLSSALP